MKKSLLASAIIVMTFTSSSVPASALEAKIMEVIRILIDKPTPDYIKGEILSRTG